MVKAFRVALALPCGRVPLSLLRSVFSGLFCLPGIPGYVCCFLLVLAFLMDCGRIELEGGRNTESARYEANKSIPCTSGSTIAVSDTF